MSVFFRSFISRVKGSVVNLANPSLYKNASKGLNYVTKTYILMSNLCPLINKGFLRYFYNTTGSAYITSDTSLITVIPLPRDLLVGFIIQILCCPSVS